MSSFRDFIESHRTDDNDFMTLTSLGRVFVQSESFGPLFEIEPEP